MCGEDLGRAYLSSLAAFTRGITAPAVSAYITGRLRHLTRGALDILTTTQAFAACTEAERRAQDPDAWTLDTELGAVDLFRAALPRVDESHPEVTAVLKGAVDTVSLTTPIPGLPARPVTRPTESLSTVLRQNVPEIRRLQSGRPMPERERKELLDSIRMRLLASVQKVAGIP